MYPEIIVIPMRQELNATGDRRTTHSEAVDLALKPQSGTALVIVNSICGCARGPHAPRRSHGPGEGRASR